MRGVCTPLIYHMKSIAEGVQDYIQTITAARWREKPMENEKLFLALRAGARAIVNNKRLHGAIYCFDIWGENGGPKEISYLEAAVLLAETADKMEEKTPEGEEDAGWTLRS